LSVVGATVRLLLMVQVLPEPAVMSNRCRHPTFSR
jgi:hypothetical protein